MIYQNSVGSGPILMVMVTATIQMHRALICVQPSLDTVLMVTMVVVMSMAMDSPMRSMIARIAASLGVTHSDVRIRMATDGRIPRVMRVGMVIATRQIGCKRSIPMAMVVTITMARIAAVKIPSQMNSHSTLNNGSMRMATVGATTLAHRLVTNALVLMAIRFTIEAAASTAMGMAGQTPKIQLLPNPMAGPTTQHVATTRGWMMKAIPARLENTVQICSLGRPTILHPRMYVVFSATNSGETAMVTVTVTMTRKMLGIVMPSR